LIRKALGGGKARQERRRRSADDRRRARKGDAPEESIDVPQLRIVEQSVWEQAHALKTEKSHLASHVKRRAPHLLSGFLRCGCCGSGMSVHDRDKTGKTRIRCSAIRESGSCSNRRIIYLRDIERLVLSGMALELKDAYVRNYNNERERLAGDAAAVRAAN
jgi:site-specific DNA recombinase